MVSISPSVERALYNARALMTYAGMPADSWWGRAWTDGPIPSDGIAQLRVEGQRTLDNPLDIFGGTIPFPPGEWANWAGYTVEWLGVFVSEAPESRTWPALTLPRVDPSVPFILQLWDQNVFPPDSKLYAEILWRPGYVKARPLVGGWDEPGYKQEHIKLAKHGLELLWNLDAAQGGRPKGTKNKDAYPTRESYVEAIRKLPARAKRSGWDLITASDSRLAQWLRIALRTMHTRNLEYGITPEAIRAQRV